MLKKLYKNNKLKISASTWNDNLNYLTNGIMYKIFNIVLRVLSKNMEQVI